MQIALTTVTLVTRSDLTSDESESWTSIRTPDDFARNMQRSLFGLFPPIFFLRKSGLFGLATVTILVTPPFVLFHFGN